MLSRQLAPNEFELVLYGLDRRVDIGPRIAWPYFYHRM
jgi:hypothetical protein